MAEARQIPSDSQDALAIVDAMVAEIVSMYPCLSSDPGPTATAEDFAPPGGAFVALYEDGRAVAGGGVKRFADGIGEIKRMYVAPDARGRGLARELLSALEDAARSLGHHTVRLDTGSEQPAALHLYRSAGYREIADYNANPHASFWGEKRLA